MKLFMSVFITDNSNTKLDRGLLQSQSRVDVFKYSLASLSAIPFTEAWIYFSCDDMYRGYEEELILYAHSCFPSLRIRPQRLLQLRDWRAAINELTADGSSELIWYSGNDDHIFVDSDLQVLNECLQLADNFSERTTDFCLSYSHWPESIGRVGRLYAHFDFASIVYVKQIDTRDSILAMPPELLKKWFFSDAAQVPEDYVIRRAENIPVRPDNFAVIVPHRELLRHFDGYSHAGISINVCPPLTIPQGFFNDGISIALGPLSAEERLELSADGYVIVDPTAENYSAVEVGGADWKVIESRVPFFWRERISRLVRGTSPVAREELLRLANKAVLDVMQQRLPIDYANAATLAPAAFDDMPAEYLQHDTPKLSEAGLQSNRHNRVFKTSTTRSADLTVILFDHEDASLSANREHLVAQIANIKSKRDIEFTYLMLSEKYGGEVQFARSIDIAGRGALGSIDNVMYHRYEFFWDLLEATSQALPFLHGPHILLIENTFAAHITHIETVIQEALDAIDAGNALPVAFLATVTNGTSHSVVDRHSAILLQSAELTSLLSSYAASPSLRGVVDQLLCLRTVKGLDPGEIRQGITHVGFEQVLMAPKFNIYLD